MQTAEHLNHLTYNVGSGRATKNKVTYLCPVCGLRVWGKPHISIVCGTCQEFFLPYATSAVGA